MWCMNSNFLDFDQVPSPSMYCHNVDLARGNTNNITDKNLESNHI